MEQRDPTTIRASAGFWPVAFLLALCFPAGLSAGAPASLPLARISVEQGLSQGTVNCILQDRRGFLWLGTQDGLNRYDGYRFAVYKSDPTDPASLAHNWIGALAEDASGDLWIGTEGGGLSRWHRATDTFTRYQHDSEDPASLPGNLVRALHFDSSGQLWIGTSRSGLARLDPATGKLERFRHDPADPTSLSDDRVRALAGGADGSLWIGTLGGLDRLDASTPGAASFVRYRHDPADPSSLSDDRVQAVLEDRAGALWVGTEVGLNRLLPAGGFARSLHEASAAGNPGGEMVRALLEDSDGRLWIGTDGGLYRRGAASGQLALYRHDAADPRSLSNDRLMTIFEDRGGMLWIGTAGGGLNTWNPATAAFSLYRADPDRPESLSSNAVYAFSEDAAGGLWVGTLGGLNVLDVKTGSFRSYHHGPGRPASLGDDRITALRHDRQGALWIGTLASGLDRMDPKSGSFRHFRHDPEQPGSLADDGVSALLEDAAGNLWIGTYRGGLDRLDRGGAAAGTFAHFRHDPADPTSLADDQVTALAEDADGALWIGTFHGGLHRFRHRRRSVAAPAAGAPAAGTPAAGTPAGEMLRIRHDPGRPESLASDSVNALHFDAAGTLWVGTQVGLHRLRRLDEASGEAGFESFFERHGLPNGVVWGICSDAGGQIWVSTNRGLSRLDPVARVFESYGASHGLQGDEFNLGAYYESRGGELYFGGDGGFNAFHPERVERNTAVPPVVVTEITKLNRPVDLGRPVFEAESLELAPGDALISIELAALDFAAPEQNRYRYKLEGLDGDFIDLGRRRRVTFTHLPPGRYTLRLQGSNNDGVWNREGASLAIEMRPAFWQTWWFRLAAGLALACLLLGIHRQRMESARRRQQERNAAERTAERERLIAKLRAKNGELERFTYTVSHDLKAPLVTIKGFLGFLQRDVAEGRTERLQEDLGRVDTAAQRMHILLEDLLQLSRIGRMVRPPEDVPLAKLVAEAAENVAGQLEEGGVELCIAPQLPVVHGDRMRLVEVLQNLLQNAVKYMGEQPSPRIEVGSRRDGGERVFFVRDNGAGIEEQYHEKIFELFQRLSPEGEGTGVGLALARRIVEVHGGRLWVESAGGGRGSTFCFTLGEAPDVSPPAADSRRSS